MSASLVGSEMCIRDSLRAARLAPSLMREREDRARPCGSSSASSPAAGGTCLLYTSDAADDM
eukprot:7234777-Alexandrium_andersonii.AAC.1